MTQENNNLADVIQLSSSNFEQIQSYLTHPDNADYLASLSDTKLNELNLRCSQHFSRLTAIVSSPWTIFVITIFLFHSWWGLKNLPGEVWDIVARIYGVFGVVIWLLYIPIRNDILSGLKYYSSKLVECLSLVSDSPDQCAYGLGLIKASTSAREYRNKVLEAGRPLRLIDVMMMERLLLVEGTLETQKRNALACKALHDLVPITEAS